MIMLSETSSSSRHLFAYCSLKIGYKLAVFSFVGELASETFQMLIRSENGRYKLWR